MQEGQSHQMGFQVLVLNVSLNPDIYSTLICTWVKKGAMYLVLWESVIVSLCQKLKNMCCYVLFHNFFLSSKLLIKLSEMGIYATETVRAKRKHMLILTPDKQMERGEHDWLPANGFSVIKWMDKKSVMLLTNYFNRGATQQID